jgi:hypothetical protein
MRQGSPYRDERCILANSHREFRTWWVDPIAKGQWWGRAHPQINPLVTQHSNETVTSRQRSQLGTSLQQSLLRGHFMPSWIILYVLELTVLNNTPFFGCTRVYLHIHLLKGLLDISNLGNYEESCYKCSGFVSCHFM